MKRNVATSFFGTAALLLALTPAIGSAGTPNPNSAVILERIFNDCPISTLTPVNAYPASISITDANPACLGYANLHAWRFSVDGVNEVKFDNNSSYSFCADLTISGTGEAESGLQIAAWFNEDGGRFNVRSTDGEVACFGDRLPFYSFSDPAHGSIRYTKGTTVHLEIVYMPNGLSAASPATIEYRYTDGSGLHTSGQLPFDEGNPAEGYGSWGELDQSKVGGHMQYFLSAVNPPNAVNVTWANICYESHDVTPVKMTTWGQVKALYHN